MATIIHKKGRGVPTAESLQVGEIAIDTYSGATYTKLSNGTVVEIGGGSGSGTGAGLVISPTEPTDPVDGMQWLDSTTARVWVWDEDKWLEFPAAGGSVEGSGLIEVSEEPPEPPYEIGQQWFSSDDGYLYIWYGAEWVAVNMSTSPDDGGTDPEPGDPYWDMTTCLINTDGAEIGTKDIVDVTGKSDITLVGNKTGPFVSGDEFKYGESSVYFSQASGVKGNIEISQCDFTKPWTMECWWFRTKNFGSQFGSLFSKFKGTTSDLAFMLFVDKNPQDTLTWRLSFDGSTFDDYTSLAKPSPNEWHHTSIGWDGSSYRLYIDGELAVSIFDSRPLYAASGTPLSVGATSNTSAGAYQHYFEGYMDDIRVTLGASRYSGDYDPPPKHPTQPSFFKNLSQVNDAQDYSNDADLS